MDFYFFEERPKKRETARAFAQTAWLNVKEFHVELLMR